MNINNLPVDIVVAILRCCLYSKTYEAKEWKSCLPALSVCQLWRFIGMPLVFNRVGISYGSIKALKQDSEPSSIVSNLGLIANAGKAGLIRHISISVYYNDNPCSGLYTIIDLLKPAKWPAVNSLHLKLEPNLQNGQAAPNTTLFNNDIASISNEIYCLLPNINSLKYLGIRPNISGLFSKLIRQYSQQITQFVNKHELADCQDLVLDRVAKLKLNMFVDSIHLLPKISPQNIVLLELAEIPYSYLWSLFATTANTIVFPSLIRLKVGYTMTTSDNSMLATNPLAKLQQPVVSFPKLKHLIVYMDEAAAPIIDKAIFPDHISTWELSGSIKMLEVMVNKPVPQVDDISMKLVYNNTEVISNPFMLVNKMAYKAARVCSTSILISKLIPTDIYYNTHCPSLTRIAITTVVASDCIPHILINMPNLEHASFIKITNPEVSEYVLNYNQYKSTDAQPFNLKLADLHLQFDKSHISAAVLFAKYLLPRLPALRALAAKQLPSSPLNRFVQEYSKHYPHLSNIIMRLQE